MSAPFLEELAKPQPNPGGGAAAAYGAALGLALLEKVVKLELRRPNNLKSVRLFWEERLAQVIRLKKELEHLRDEDVAAYMKLARALRGGGRELPFALEEAIDCPRRIMGGAFGGLKETAAAGDKCRKHLVADLHVAAEFFGAALLGAYQIAAANLPLLGPIEVRQNHAGKLEALLRQGNLTLHGVRRLLTDRTSSPGGP
jgi:methenyltetrahydrofolate cyclohydrolase